jgi:dTDP-4-amino-4,6-dideoxygalactose transaminase
MTANSIPFLDLVTPHLELEPELISVFQNALRTASFVGGAAVEDFEKAFAAFCGTRFAVGVGSGTDAVRFALMAVGVKKGDIVITVPNTFIATTEAISQAGATPEFVDIDERTYNMDPEALRRHLQDACSVSADGQLISKRCGRPVTAVVPVHLYGQMADMDPIINLAEQYRLTVVEDACQAHGAEYLSRRYNAWLKAGSIGRVAAFSFYPGKNLGACGEAGAVTTNDEVVASRIRMYRDHGQTQKYFHDLEGYNGRLDAIQAGILAVKLTHLPLWNKKRREAADKYSELLIPLGDAVILPQEPRWARSVYHLYVIRAADRATLQELLSAVRIGTGIHYPVPLHLQTAYTHLGYRRGAFPVCEAVAQQILSLPMHPQLQVDQQLSVMHCVMRYASQVVARHHS